MLRKIIKSILLVFDDNIFRWTVKLFYSEYKRPRKGYMYNYKILIKFAFMQKIIGFNRRIPWPVDFRSQIIDWKNIEKGIMCDPGDNIGIYINASGGLKIGNNVNIGQNTIISTNNHYKYDHRKMSTTKGVIIGNNVWVGANCSILAGVEIGSNVTIGAGSTIRKNIPSNCTVYLNNDSLKIVSKSKAYEWDVQKEKL